MNGRTGTPDDGLRSRTTICGSGLASLHRPTTTRPIFVDSSGRRRRHIRRLCCLLTVPALGYVGVLVGTVLTTAVVAAPLFPGQSPHHVAAVPGGVGGGAGGAAASSSPSNASPVAGATAIRAATPAVTALTGTQSASTQAGEPLRIYGGSAPAPSRPPFATSPLRQPSNPAGSPSALPRNPSPSLTAPPSATAPPRQERPTPTAPASSTAPPSSSPSPSPTTPTTHASPTPTAPPSTTVSAQSTVASG